MSIYLINVIQILIFSHPVSVGLVDIKIYSREFDPKKDRTLVANCVRQRQKRQFHLGSHASLQERA